MSLRPRSAQPVASATSRTLPIGRRTNVGVTYAEFDQFDTEVVNRFRHTFDTRIQPLLDRIEHNVETHRLGSNCKSLPKAARGCLIVNVWDIDTLIFTLLVLSERLISIQEQINIKFPLDAMAVDDDINEIAVTMKLWEFHWRYTAV
jgi:hypothetical protein